MDHEQSRGSSYIRNEEEEKRRSLRRRVESIIESSPERSKHGESLEGLRKGIKGEQRLRVLNSLLSSMQQKQRKDTSPYAKTKEVKYPVVQLPQIRKKQPA